MFRIGDRVRIIRKNFGHPDLEFLTGLEGTISLVEEPWRDDRKQRLLYEVEWPEPKGPRGYIGHFPLFEEDLELINMEADHSQ